MYIKLRNITINFSILFIYYFTSAFINSNIYNIKIIFICNYTYY